MKKLVLFLGITLSITAGSRAQNEVAVATTLSPGFLLKDAPLKASLHSAAQHMIELKGRKSPEHYQKLKRAGIILTGVGVASFTGGLLLISAGNKENNREYNYATYNGTTPGDNKLMAGALGILGSVPALGGGITMWAIGHNRLKKYADRVHINAGARSATFAYRF
ncbi:MAG: hypothetical protein J7539_00465 [Niabella sp.]|nr:hypothetical protein [Niabella sp.]